MTRRVEVSISITYFPTIEEDEPIDSQSSEISLQVDQNLTVEDVIEEIERVTRTIEHLHPAFGGRNIGVL